MELQKLEVLLPHNIRVTIRETNGEDDDIISKVKDNKDNTAVCKFLSSIIVSEVLTPEDIMLWPIASKYYLLLKSRIHSLGNILKFKYEFKEENSEELKSFDFEEDLNKYDADLETLLKLSPEELSKEAAKLSSIQIRPYKYGPVLLHEKKLSSGKVIRLQLLDTHGEKASMGKSGDEMTINDKLRFRHLEVKLEEGWAKVQNFKAFSSRDMQEIRQFAEEIEVRFDMPMGIENPITKEYNLVPLISLPDFFFPVAI